MAVTSPSYQLSDEQWAKIEHLLPSNNKRGRPWKDHRLMIAAILWVLSDGGRWRNVPDRFGPWQSVYDRFRRWTRRGLWDRILEHLQARKMNSGEIDFELFAIDGSVIRAHQSAAGAGEKKSTGRRTGGPRPRTQQGRLQHQSPSDLRRQWHADGGGAQPRRRT